jgi:nitrogen fixation NifU-like protein
MVYLSSNLNENGSLSFMEMIEKILLERYGETIVDHVKNPRNNQLIEDANGYTSFEGACEDIMEIWVKVVDDIIEEIAFRSNGCDITQATGSMLTEMVKGKEIPEALKINPLQIDDALGGLPEDHTHCAALARDALHKAIENYKEGI